jgi:putative SOS response-associated peptidase YedK
MCGRFTLIRLADFVDVFPWIRDGGIDWQARYNVAPTQPVPVVTASDDPTLELFRWGLIPRWAKDESVGNKMINARGETVAEKPAFRSLVGRKRCVVPASGFYEWRREPGDNRKTPMYITPADATAFAFAGLWDEWRRPADGQSLRTFAILTTAPNELMSTVHDRMPVILPEEDVKRWLTPGDDAKPLELIRSFDARRMRMHAVSRNVNSPRSQGAHLIQPADPTDAKPANDQEAGLFG